MKERLTGAIILVALIVLLVPELLTGPPRLISAGTPSRRPGIVAAAAGSAPVRSYTLPLGAGAGARMAAIQVAPQAPAPAGTAQAAAPMPAKSPPVTIHPLVKAKVKVVSEPRPQAAAPLRPKAKPLPRQRPAAHAGAPPPPRRSQRAPSGARWAVQLGVFAFRADALRLGQRVRARGIPVRITPLHIRGRLLWRVATGAVSGHAAGLALARRLRGLGLKGELLRQ